MTIAKICAECGATLPESALGDRCPKCLIQLGLEASDEATALSISEPPEPPTAIDPLSQTHVRRFGDYELLDQIARGGMGVVYKARQVKLNRVVALKMILSGQFASKQEVLRFRSEAEVAANLRHPNIVAIYETGECEGQHYFSMEYVQGRNLAEIARDGPLPAQRAARYLQVVAEAIDYAHQQGTLHRDLKPSNVLMDANDQPRITDFGLAKRVRGDFGLTVTGQVLGSPNFMPPEQTGAKHAKVGPASDVYGIGAILYHLLTGRPPFQAEAIEDVLLQLRENEPVAPRLLNPRVPHDLETICLKCLKKEPPKRYPTVQALVEELRRFLRDEPVLARPATGIERAWRWCRRKPVIASLASATVALVLVVAIGSAIAAFRINHGAQTLRQNLYVADINVAEQAAAENNFGRALDLLKKHIPRPREVDLRGFEWRYLWRECQGDQLASLKAHEDGVSTLALSPDGRFVASGGLYEDRTVRVWDVATQRPLAVLPKTENILFSYSIAFSSDSRYLAVAPNGHSTILWDTANWQESGRIPMAGAWPSFSPDGKYFAATFQSNDVRQVRIWDIDAGTFKLRSVWTIPVNDGGIVAFSLLQSKYMACFSGPSSTNIALWDLNSGTKIGNLPQGRFTGNPLAFSPCGNLLAVGDQEDVRLWDVRTQQEMSRWSAHKLNVSSLAFSPDGERLLTGSFDQLVHLWKVRTGAKLASYLQGPLRYRLANSFCSRRPNACFRQQRRDDPLLDGWTRASEPRTNDTADGHSTRLFAG